MISIVTQFFVALTTSGRPGAEQCVVSTSGGAIGGASAIHGAIGSGKAPPYVTPLSFRESSILRCCPPDFQDRLLSVRAAPLMGRTRLATSRCCMHVSEKVTLTQAPSRPRDSHIISCALPFPATHTFRGFARVLNSSFRAVRLSGLHLTGNGGSGTPRRRRRRCTSCCPGFPSSSRTSLPPTISRLATG